MSNTNNTAASTLTARQMRRCELRAHYATALKLGICDKRVMTLANRHLKAEFSKR